MIQLTTPARVLVVEDNPLNLEMVCDILEAEGYQVITATDGAEALRQWIGSRDDPPDLILMDVQLPVVIDGLTVTRRSEVRPGPMRIPIIAVTAHAMRGDERIIFEAGCDDYIAKPIDLQSFLKTVARNLPAKLADPKESPT